VSTNEPARLTTDQLAEERTFLAAERTLFAVLRTGLAIAGGGSLVISLLGERWPAWVQVPLAAIFLTVGYGMAFMGLARYRAIVIQAQRHQTGRSMMSLRLLTIGLLAVQAAIVVMVVLFGLRAFE
jgi:uncharacterized membrane protein YidH (DUF202 family)